MWRLAEYYRDGRGVILQDEARARYWLRRAFHGGNEFAGYLLGDMLEASGREAEAAEVYRLTNAYAFHELSRLLYRRRDLYRFGDPLPSKYSSDCGWFQRALEEADARRRR